MSKILIVEDEEAIADLEKDYLELSGFEVQVANDGEKGLEKALNEDYDLLILDLMLPGMDGFEVMEKIRETATPVIFLTAMGDVSDRVKGLKSGAEDYIVKPFEMKEVLARIHAVLRRYGAEEGSEEKKLSFDKLVINLDSYELLVDGRRVDTPPKELELLYFLASSPNQVFTRELWESATECPVVFPDGVGVVGWMVPGGRAIAEKTAELMEKYDVAIWAHHGMFCSGEDFDLTFGLMHTVEKSAEILVKILSMTPRKIQTITPENFRELAHDFNVTLPEEFLYEKKK